MKRIIFLFICGLGIFSINHISFQKVDSIETDSIKEVIKYENDILGKIEIDHQVDYIVQTTDNEFYLNHNHKKEEDSLGAVFLDYRNKIEDKKLLVYGHNSKTLNPFFKQLEQYLDESYYLEHSAFQIKLNNKEYSYRIFSVYITELDDYSHTKITFKEKEYQEYLTLLREKSIYDTGVEVTEHDYIITLQTCNYNPENTYLLINAKREESL